MTNQGNPPRKRGCFFYGCIALIIAVLIASVGAVLLFRYAQHSLRTAVNAYTDAQPSPLENVDTSPDKVKAVQDKIAAFREAIQNQKGAELVLTADEINTLIASDPNRQDLANHLRLLIEGDQVKARISWPLEDIGPFKLEGRYLNGVAILNVSMEKGKLHARIEDVTAKGKPLPPVVLDKMKTIDFGSNFQQDPQGAAAVSQIDNVQVKDGRVIIRGKEAR
jgi:hypothetical protein